MDNDMKYENLDMEVIFYEQEDVITDSLPDEAM